MRVMVMEKATSQSEAGQMPSTELLAAIGNYNAEVVKADVLLAGEGLHPSARGKRVHFSGSQRTVIDGPFTETKGLVAGLWLWQVKSVEEAVEWIRRCPNPMEGDSEIELAPLFDAADFGAELTPELRTQERRLRAEVEGVPNGPRWRERVKADWRRLIDRGSCPLKQIRNGMSSRSAHGPTFMGRVAASRLLTLSDRSLPAR